MQPRMASSFWSSCLHVCLNRSFIHQELFGSIKRDVYLEWANCMRHSAVGVRYQGLHSQKLFLVLFFSPTSWPSLSLGRAYWQRGVPFDLENFLQTIFVFRKKSDRNGNLLPLSYVAHCTCLHLEPISSGVEYRRNDIKLLLFMARWAPQFWSLLKGTVLYGDGAGTWEG